MSLTRAIATLLAGLFLGASLPARADDAEHPPDRAYLFVADPDFGMETGIRSSMSLLHLAFLYDRALAAEIDLDESTASGRALGVAGRLVKLVFVDSPLVELHETFVHEVFGHGARGRESGVDAGYTFRLPLPYDRLLRAHSPYAGMTIFEDHDDPERSLPRTFGGIESGYWRAWWIQLETLSADGWVHYGDMMSYGVAKLDYSDDLAANLSHPPDDPDSKNDPQNYIDGLQHRFGLPTQEDRTSIARSLRRAYVWNFVDPTFWMFAYHGLVNYLWFGRRHVQLPTLPAGPIALYPATRFNLSPFGAEHYLDLFARTGSLVLDAYGRVGSSGLASYWGFGLRAFGLRGPLGLELGAEADGWTQPEFLFDQRYVFERTNRIGGSGGLHVDWRGYRGVGLTAKLAWKTRGYLMGQPLEEGPYGYFGLSFAPALTNR